MVASSHIGPTAITASVCVC